MPLDPQNPFPPAQDLANRIVRREREAILRRPGMYLEINPAGFREVNVPGEPLPDMPDIQEPQFEIADLPEGNIKFYLPPFKMPYDSPDEVSRRLRGGIIIVKGNPYYVHSAFPYKGDTLICLFDEHQKVHNYLYKDVDTLRSPPPTYITFSDRNRGTYWLYRRPSTPQDNVRGANHGDYIQGLTSRNALVKPVGMDSSHVNYPPQYPNLIKALKTKATLKWKGEFEELMFRGIIPDMRLTDVVAIFVKGKGIRAEYKGRLLGKVTDGRVKLTDEDKDTPWISEDLSLAGLETC